LTGAGRGASRPAFPVHAEFPSDEDEPLLVEDEPPDPPEFEEDDPEDEPESRDTAVPTVGESAGRERSCAQSGVRLSANAAAARPIVNV